MTEPSFQQKIDFGKHKYYGITKPNEVKLPKSANGKLVWVKETGKEEDIQGYYDMPWGLLQHMKKKLVANGNGFTKKNVQLRHL